MTAAHPESNTTRLPVASTVMPLRPLKAASTDAGIRYNGASTSDGIYPPYRHPIIRHHQIPDLQDNARCPPRRATTARFDGVVAWLTAE